MREISCLAEELLVSEKRLFHGVNHVVSKRPVVKQLKSYYYSTRMRILGAIRLILHVFLAHCLTESQGQNYVLPF
jgi:acyl carrier protein phosphodiesterase